MSALITGASSGIGKALALELARDGHDLVLVSRDRSRLEDVANECEKLGVKTMVLAEDLSTPDSGKKLFNAVDCAGFSIDILVNNAGFGVHGEFESTDLEKELQLVQLQITSLVTLTKLVLPGMKRAGKGKILNVASVYAFSPVPFQAVYSGCKAFMLNFSQALASELQGSGVEVTVVCPGITRTEFRQRAGIRDKNSGMTAEAVAAHAYRAMQKGRRVAVPGVVNRLFVGVVRILPGLAVTLLLRGINTIRGVNHRV